MTPLHKIKTAVLEMYRQNPSASISELQNELRLRDMAIPTVAIIRKWISDEQERTQKA